VLGGAVIWYERHEPYTTQGPEGLAAPHGPRMPTAISPNVAATTTARPTSVVTSGLFGTLALMIGFGSLGFVLWLFFADRRVCRMPADFDHPDGRLATAAEDGLEDLRREPDARVAIIRIYHNFERALAGAKMPKPPWQTPMEFMRSVLAKLPLPAPPVGELTGLFEIARFSRHPVGTAEREAAWHALTEIRAKLEEEAEVRRVALS
jgi:Domain of unknown function (DUF4129)